MLAALALGISLTFNGHTWSYDTAFLSTMPGATIVFEAAGPIGKYELRAERGTIAQKASRKWSWTAPETPGRYKLTLDGPGDDIDVHAFVLVPANRVRNGLLNGFRIGTYPPARGRYQPPPGFIEVTRDNEDTKVSPHFKLKQFLCKQEPADQFPKYVTLQEPLLLKLEAVLEHVRSLGFKAGTLYVMSGYRTPFYNRAIGDVAYSMHQWGGAADVFVDTNHEGEMDDLNHDGHVDIDDAKFLYDEVDRMLATRAFQTLQGGLGFYPATRAHPPFVHLDARGTKARWKG